MVIVTTQSSSISLRTVSSAHHLSGLSKSEGLCAQVGTLGYFEWVLCCGLCKLMCCGVYVEASIFLNPTLVKAHEFALSRSELGKGSVLSSFLCC